MKKVLILLLGVALISSACGRADKKAAAKQAEIERIRMRQDSARRADAERLLELQMKARQDSLAMAIALSNMNSSESSLRRGSASSFYVVVGSFKVRANADRYLRQMRGTFSDAQLITNRGWNYVCVGGRFGSWSAAARTLNSVKSRLGSGGGDDDEEEEGDDEEEEDEDDGGDEEDEEEDEDEDDDDGGGSGGGSGQAWVMGV